MQSRASSKRIESELVTETNVQSLRYLHMYIELFSNFISIFFRMLFEKIFPILSMTEMKGNFYSNFTSNLGFAILAFYDKKLVDIKNEI